MMMVGIKQLLILKRLNIIFRGVEIWMKKKVFI